MAPTTYEFQLLMLLQGLLKFLGFYSMQQDCQIVSCKVTQFLKRTVVSHAGVSMEAHFRVCRRLRAPFVCRNLMLVFMFLHPNSHTSTSNY